MIEARNSAESLEIAHALVGYRTEDPPAPMPDDDEPGGGGSS